MTGGRDGWKSTWHDEFDGDAVDRDQWDFDIGNGFLDHASHTGVPGWGNEELLYDTDSPANASVAESENIDAVGMTTLPRRVAAVATIMATAVLAACGGGGGAAGPATPPPATANAAPVADAGVSRSVALDAVARLDGSASRDPDGDAIAWRWTLRSRPAGSRATLDRPTAVDPTFVADVPGDYVVVMRVDDALLDSAPVTVTLTATPSWLPAGYTLAWSDEFAVDGLPDASKWDHDTDRNRAGWYNAERQYYARDRAENAVVADGRLLITARLESLVAANDWGGQHYTSARLVTRGKAQWTTGIVDVRAKLPCGQGTWPAIWMLGSGGTWPDDGEIDIMEQTGGDPTRILGTVHTRHTIATVGGIGDGGTTRIADPCTAFHDYRMTWTADRIDFAVDGVTFHTVANPRIGRTAWPFDAPQYLLLNIAIGGTLGGTVDDRIFPVTMAVEHVRVWQAPR